MTDLIALKAANASRWANAKLLKPGSFNAVAKHLIEPSAKARYQQVSLQTGVPWAVIAVIHEREASQNWKTQLGQGDPLDRPSVHIPAGRGPFTTWEDGAVDALVNCAPYAARNKDWSVGGTLTQLELYNGTGYANRNLPSPYLWAGTDQYKSGKYVKDGVFDPNAVDQQLGVAGLILTMMQLDPSISFDGPAPQVQPKPTKVNQSSEPIRDGIWLQNSLNRLGANPKLVLDGIVGPATRNAVRAFQLASGIGVDGLTGPETFAAIDKALAAGKPVPTMPVPPDIVLPPPGTQAHADLADTFWGRVAALFKPKRT